MSGRNRQVLVRRRAMLRGLMLVVGAGVTGTLLEACGQAAPRAPAAPTQAAQQAPAQATPAAAAAGAAPSASDRVPLARQQDPGPPKRGGTLETSVAKDPETLEVMHSVNGPLRISSSLVYRRLVQFRGTEYGDAQVEPDMADSWTVSPDGKIWTFKLHKGIRWHNVAPVNGREFTSADVAWTVDWYKKNSPEYAWLYDWVSGVETPDDYTVIFHSDKPNAEALMNLAVDNNAILPHEVFEQDGNFRSKMIGTGPYIWKSWEPGVKIVLERNPDYWEVSELDGKQLPYLDQIIMYVMPDYATRLAAYRSGKIAGHRWGFQPTPQDIDALWNSIKNQRRWDGVHFLSGGGLILNTSRKPWDDVRVRRAASMAIDRNALIRDVVQGKGQWMPFVSSAFTDYAWSQDRLKGLEYLQYNPDRARALLQEAGVGDTPVPIDFHPDPSPVTKVLVETVQQAWKDIGMNVSIDAVDVPTSYGRRETGDYSVFGNGVGFSSASIDAATRQLYTKDGGRNYGKVSDPKLEELGAAQAQELDLDKRKQLVDQFQQQLYDQMWFIPTYDALETLVNQPWARNWAFHWQLAWPHAERIWVDKG
jgi:peptide/nickel transport system substrate-binding protein